MKNILIAVLMFLAIYLGSRVYDLQYKAWGEARRIPECQEDATLIGHGDFQAGQWDYYLCGPSVDDYQSR